MAWQKTMEPHNLGNSPQSGSEVLSIMSVSFGNSCLYKKCCCIFVACVVARSEHYVFSVEILKRPPDLSMKI